MIVTWVLFLNSAGSGSSSSIFTQAALPLLAVAVVLIVATMVIIATALILIRRKKAAVAKCGKQDNGSWNATYTKQDGKHLWFSPRAQIFFGHLCIFLPLYV